ncbi:sulfite exporter TauE/SafE family protein [Paramicrobacterium fandaimingii]|uniref:sulfite exporter TauE/SafE family protein n=1 Tax=Paramicrobacterium fandaimingii TaxID=2708079 RepID=UPI001422B40F|nr:sulfite exporter TauE/SafE family protein [Microbacterium fandaimingii]
MRRRVDWLWFVVIGLIAGFMSGLFGVGGGILIVPLLITLAGFGQKRAAGTSLAAIVPTSLAGVITYAIHGDLALIAAAVLAVGSIIGAQIGSLLLHRLPKNVVQWAFIVFVLIIVVSLFFVVPSREADIHLGALSIIGLLVLGLAVGILSGILGIGGGAVIVPMLILLFGASDLVAKGTSLAVMIPTAISGTIGNSRRRNVDIPAALTIGLCACLTTSLGALVAVAIDPMLGNILFAVFLLIIAIQLSVKAIRSR